MLHVANRGNISGRTKGARWVFQFTRRSNENSMKQKTPVGAGATPLLPKTKRKMVECLPITTFASGAASTAGSELVFQLLFKSHCKTTAADILIPYQSPSYLRENTINIQRPLGPTMLAHGVLHAWVVDCFFMHILQS